MSQQRIDSGDQAGLSFGELAQSTVAAAFGVQSSRNKQRDFTRGRFLQFVAAGVLFTTLFVFAVVGVVQWVLPG